MRDDLARKMIAKGFIHQNTEIDAYYQGKDISGCGLARSIGSFSIRTAKVISGQLVFEAVSTSDGHSRRIPCSDVTRIDGMDPERFSANFGLDGEGDVVAQGKRRGRKPKPKVTKENLTG